MRDRPARRARHEAEPLLPVDAVDLVDDAVDVVVELARWFLDLAMKRDQLLDRMAELGQRIGPEAAALEPSDHAGLRIGRHLGHLAPGIGEEAQRARGGDARDPSGAASPPPNCADWRTAVSPAAFDLLLVEREKRLLGHVDLAAHLADVGHVAALQFFRHVLERADVGGDVLALGAVAAGGGGDELAVLVAQRHRQPVDLRLGAEVDPVVVGELEEAPDAADEVEHVLARQRRCRATASAPHAGPWLKRPDGGAPIFCDGDSLVTNSGNLASMALKRRRSASYSASEIFGASS